MKTISILLILGAFVLGMRYDGRDITAVVVMGLLFLPVMFQGKDKDKDVL